MFISLSEIITNQLSCGEMYFDSLQFYSDISTTFIFCS